MKPWQDRFIRRVGIVAWFGGLAFGILKIVVYYGSGPLVVYLMVRFLT